MLSRKYGNTRVSWRESTSADPPDMEIVSSCPGLITDLTDNRINECCCIWERRKVMVVYCMIYN